MMLEQKLLILALAMSLQQPYFKLCVGAKAKQATHGIMRTLPTPATIEDNEDVKAAFHLAFFQGEDQAKAIIKGGLAHLAEIQYLNFIGPYWMSVIYGPFTPTQLEISTHKPSDSADFIESVRASRKLAQMPIHCKLYSLRTAESNVKLEDIIQSTDAAVKLLIQQMPTIVSLFVIVMLHHPLNGWTEATFYMSMFLFWCISETDASR